MLAIAGGIILAAFLIWLVLNVVYFVIVMIAQANPLGILASILAALMTLALLGCVFG
jgi:hypothetical protein